MNGSDSLVELETVWSLDDIVKANILLNYNAEVKEEIEHKMDNQNGHS